METICTITTKDNKKYKIQLGLIKRYSAFFNVMFDDQPTSQIQLNHISSPAFDYVYEFLQLHKTHPPQELSKPVLRNVKLNTIMTEQDAELMERINALQTQLQLQIINTAMYLQMDSFKKLLTYTLIQKQLQQQFKQIEENKNFQNQVKKEIHQKITNLIEMENHRKRLAEQNFEDVHVDTQ